MENVAFPFIGQEVEPEKDDRSYCWNQNPCFCIHVFCCDIAQNGKKRKDLDLGRNPQTLGFNLNSFIP